jgi:hypothetical protein
MRASRYQAILSPSQTCCHARLLATLGIELIGALSIFIVQRMREALNCNVLASLRMIRTPNEPSCQCQRKNRKKKATIKPTYGLAPNRTGIVCMNALGFRLPMECRRGPPATKPYSVLHKPHFMRDFFCGGHRELNSDF